MATAYKLSETETSALALAAAGPKLAETLASGLGKIAVGPAAPDMPGGHDHDVFIRDAYERVRAHRAHVYSLDALPDDAAEVQAAKAEERAREADEDLIWSTPASTIEGVVCQLLLTIPQRDASRWVDHTLMRDGLDAVLARAGELNWHARQAASAARDLRKIAGQAVGEDVSAANADWAALVADYRSKLAIWCATDTSCDLATSDFLSDFGARHPEPPKPGLEPIDTTISLDDILARSKTPEHKAAWAKYEIDLAEWERLKADLGQRTVGDLKRQTGNAYEQYSNAMDQVTNYRASSHAMLAEKIEIILAEYAGCEVPEELLHEVLKDVNHLAIAITTRVAA